METSDDTTTETEAQPDDRPSDAIWKGIRARAARQYPDLFEDGDSA